MSYSLLLEILKNELKAYRAAEEILSLKRFLERFSTSTIRDGVKHGQMRFIHSFIPTPPPPHKNTCYATLETGQNEVF